MPFRFAWRDQQKNVMVYSADGQWNWRDYHHAARASAFALMAGQPPVDCVIDLRGSARPQLPAGAAAHVRSFARKTQANLSGRAAVIGLDAAEAARLGADAAGMLPTADGMVTFARDEAALARILAGWAAAPPAG